MTIAARAIVGVLGVLIASQQLMAQSCPCPAFDLAQSVKNADTIFVGRSLSATNDSAPAMRNGSGGWKDAGVEFQTRLTFEVQTVIKGNLPRFAEVVTPTGLCGFGFAVGERYLIMGVRRGGGALTCSCQE